MTEQLQTELAMEPIVFSGGTAYPKGGHRILELCMHGSGRTRTPGDAYSPVTPDPFCGQIFPAGQFFVVNKNGQPDTDRLLLKSISSGQSHLATMHVIHSKKNAQNQFLIFN